ncbi:MAG: hypothetical protein ACI4M6_06805 [Christensenellaceae bacterium]
MKKLASLMICILLAVTLCSCNANVTPGDSQESSSLVTENSSVADSSTTSSQNSSSSPVSSTSAKAVLQPEEAPLTVSYNTTPVKPTLKDNPKIFLAGDSTVKTYAENTYIGGWGQFLQSFMNSENVTVVNCAEGGRSSRSFINEGRLYTLEGKSYTTYQSIESQISSGDYLFIQFGHNDDMTRNNFDTYLERQVALGTPDDKGVFPTVIPEYKVHKTHIPEDYLKEYEYNQAKINEAYSIGNANGGYYYSADQGTFKGYLKMYIDFARSKGAIPVLATPVARVKFDNDFNLLAGNGRHGPNFEYVTAVRQLAEEEDCLLIDLFDFTKVMLETSAKNAQNKEEANYLMALKPNSLQGSWPTGYDEAYNNKDAGYTGIEGTHYNKYGAYLTAAKVAEALINFSNASEATSFEESISFGASILTTPTAKIAPSGKMQASTVTKLTQLLTIVQVA